MPHLVLMVDGQPVAEADVPARVAEPYVAAFPQAYVPQQYPKWVERDGQAMLVSSAEEENGEEPAPEPEQIPEPSEAE